MLQLPPRRRGRSSALGALLLPLAMGCHESPVASRSPHGRSNTEIYNAYSCEPSFAVRRASDGSTVGTGIVAAQKYTVTDSRNCGVASWQSGNASVVSITGGSQATLQAIAYDAAQTAVTVYGKLTSGETYPLALTISRPNLFLTDHATISVGATGTLYMELYESTGQKIPSTYWPSTPTFTSDAPTVATAVAGNPSGVGRDVLVAGRAGGNAIIRTTFFGSTTTSSITVSTVPAASVTLSAVSKYVLYGETFQLVATVRDAAGNVLSKPVSWSSSNPSIVQVDQTGKVSGVSLGQAVVTATVDGVSASATITVHNSCRDCTNPSLPPADSSIRLPSVSG